MQSAVDQFLPSLQSLGLWGYWVIGAFAFLEALVLTSVFAPATVFVVFAGLLTAQGVYDFGDMVWFVAIGAILGAESSFRLGTKGGHIFRQGRRFFSDANLQRARRFFNKYGSASLVIGRFFGPLGAVVPFVAGLSDMRRRSFHLWNIVGGFAYSAGLLSLGYFFGTALDLMTATITRAGLFLGGLTGALALIWFLVARLRRTLPFVRSILQSVFTAIGENPDFQSLAKRHPRISRFLAARFSKAAFLGLPTTILGAAFAYFLVLFIGSNLDFILNAPIIQADTRIAKLLYALRDPALVNVFTVITAFGFWKVVIVIATGASVMMWLGKHPHYIIALWAVLIGNQVTVTAMKNIFARPRPELAVFTEHSLSFPSGHSAVSVACFGLLTYIIIRERYLPALLAGAIGLTMIGLIGLSRIYLVEHYFSDVVNGYLVGALWALLGIWLAELLQEKGIGIWQPLARRWRNFWVLIVAAATVGAIVVAVDHYDPVKNTAIARVENQPETTLEDAFTQHRFPVFTETITGAHQEPVSLIILAADRETFVAGIKKAGWQLADAPGFATMGRAAFAAWFNVEYATAPVTPAFWNAQPHDYGFQKETPDKSLRRRHHARFWDTHSRTADGLMIFVGTASFDISLKWGVTHHIDPNIDAERDFLADDIRASGLVQSERALQIVQPSLGQNLSGDPFFTDGDAVVLELGTGS